MEEATRVGNLWIAIRLGLIVSLPGSFAPVMAQGTIPTPGPSTTFQSVEVDVAAGELAVALSAVSLEAGAAIPLGGQHSPTVAVVTTGTVTFDPAADVQILAAASGAATPAPASSGLAETGAVLAIPANVDLSLAAADGAPAQLTLLELGPAIDTTNLPAGVTVTLLSNDTVPVDTSRVRLDVQRQTLVQWATTEKWPTELARFLIIESGSVAVDLEGGKAQVGRSYGGQETLVAPPETGSPEAHADPDPQAGTEQGESGEGASQTPIPTPPVPPLSGTVAGLSMGDVAIVTGIGAVEFQGAGDGPSTLLSISLVSADAG
jgi:hypothetical protein